jgi:hypothetical protein
MDLLGAGEPRLGPARWTRRCSGNGQLTLKGIVPSSSSAAILWG